MLAAAPSLAGQQPAASLPIELTLVAASSTTVAAALGFTRQQRRAYFIQQCLFRHVRRYLLVLSPTSLDLRIRGIFPRLRSCWRALTSATGELFAHPHTAALLADIELTALAIQRAGTLETCLTSLLDRVNWVGEARAAALDEGLDQLRLELLAELSSRAHLRAGWRRFQLSWARVFVLHSHVHGYVKHRRARSIKRRQTKRLVRQTMFRF